ncbi:hypothetical protein [Streptomyces sp. NPDC059604]|uniref:hypothetical protein n=1 Tax=Streptomyces sp. NPDC059604 TaxID=3346881 RepID=UPI00369DA84C
MSQLSLPGNPAELHLRYHFDHSLTGDAHEQTVECWQVDIHHDSGICHVCCTIDGTAGSCEEDACSRHAPGPVVGHMTFYRIRLTQGMNGYEALKEVPELGKLADDLLDPRTGYFTEEVDQYLPYTGTDLLIMDRVVLDRPWRGAGLGSILAAEAIDRIGLGCRAVACTPGVSDPAPDWHPDQDEWDRVAGRIAAAWRRAGFIAYRDTTYLLTPTSPEAELARDVLRTDFQDLCLLWRADEDRYV